MSIMRVTIVQSSLVWENADANRLAMGEKLRALAGQTDLIVLPEMFTTGFSMNAAALAEGMDGPSVRWMQAQANALDAALVGSFICRDNNAYYNRLLWAFPDGRIQTYDKRHLFGLAGEHAHYTQGQTRISVSWKGWKICPLICYDLRFPVWSRNTPGDQAYDLLIYIANWPVRRSHHWQALLKARAIENQAYTIGVNIVGTDGSGLEYSGDSTIIDYYGTPICHISGSEGVYTTKLSIESLLQYRRQFPFLADADVFNLTI